MKLALFDLDNTLLGGDSDYHWNEFLIDKGIVDRLSHDEANKRFYAEYEAGTIRMEDWLAFQLAPIANRPRAELDGWHREYMAARVHPIILPQARELLRRHQADLRVIITATNRFIVAPICAELGVENVIASDYEEIDGVITGKPAGLPSFGAGKVTRLTEWLAKQGKRIEDFEQSWFYSDSHNDIPLLERVSHAVAVDPDARLKKKAEERGWPVISLRGASPEGGGAKT
jgi:HAD superfamily hydrolase (TIGR01490 family)